MITMTGMNARLVRHHRAPIKLASSSGERVLLLLAFRRNSGFDVFLFAAAFDVELDLIAGVIAADQRPQVRAVENRFAFERKNDVFFPEAGLGGR